MENEIIQHHFVEDRNNNQNNIHYLCGEGKNIHFNSIPVLFNSINNNFGIAKDSLNSSHNFRILKDEDIKNYEKSEIQIESPMCLELFIPNNKNIL